jgi:hypothetical protein
MRSTKMLLVAGRALAPPAAAVTVMVAQPAGASWPAAVRPFQRWVGAAGGGLEQGR